MDEVVVALADVADSDGANQSFRLQFKGSV